MPKEILLAGTTRLISENAEAEGARYNNTDVFLVPAPSTDPEDPLNWSAARKLTLIACLAASSFSSAFANSVVYSILVPLSQQTGLTVKTLNAGTGYLFLLGGWGLLIWQPIGQCFGKRGVFLICLAGTIGCTLWAPFAHGNGQWIGRSILAGLFVAPWEGMPATCINDTFFQHERGLYMAIYTFALGCGNFLSPVLCGFIGEYAGWRWTFYVASILNGAVLLVCIFCLEDTNYSRRYETYGKAEAVGQDTKVPTVSATKSHAGIVEVDLDRPRKSWLRSMSVWHPVQGPNVFHRAVDTLTYLTWPLIFFCGFIYGSSIIWINVMNATVSVVLDARPYSFSPSLVGLSYLAPVIAYVLTSIAAGPVNDFILVKRARARNGIAESEDRLLLYFISLVLTPAGLILWGVGAAHHVHWFGLVFAFAMLGCTATLGAALSFTYLVESYPALAGETTTSIVLVRNTMSFAINYGITPWVMNLGLQNCFISAAFVGMAATATFIPVLVWGKSLRERTSEAYSKKAEAMNDYLLEKS